MDDNVIRYSDFFVEDPSIDELIKKLNSIKKTYLEIPDAVKQYAQALSNHMKAIDKRTREGKEAVKEYAAAAEVLLQALAEYQVGVSDLGKALTLLKDASAKAAKETRDLANAAKLIDDSYSAIDKELKSVIDEYKHLSAAERDSAESGQMLLLKMTSLNAELKEIQVNIDRALNPPAVPAAGSIDEARQKVSKLRAELEAMSGVDLASPIGENKRQEIADAEATLRSLLNTYEDTKHELTELEKIQARLAQTQEQITAQNSDEYKELQRLLVLKKQQKKEAEILARLNAAQVGSYESLRAEYDMIRFKLNALDQTLLGSEIHMLTIDTATGKVTKSTKEWADQAYNLGNRLKQLNETAGNTSMNVGNYARTFDGLTFSIVQVARELPSLAINANTFFLAISNNIPMVVDEISRVRAAAAAAGKEIPSVFKVITGTLKSGMLWLNIAIVALTTVFSLWGNEITDFLKRLVTGHLALTQTEKALKAVNEQFKAAGKEFGKAYTSFYMLREEFKNLRTEAEKQKWIKNHKNDFHQLGVSVTNLKDAEVLFVEKSDKFVKALIRQAMAAAALKSAQDKLEKSFEDFMKAELSKEKMEELLKTSGIWSFQDGEEIADQFLKGYYDKVKKRLGSVSEVLMGEGIIKDAAGNWVEVISKEEMKHLNKIVKEYNTREKLLKAVAESEGEVSNIMKYAGEWAKDFNDTLERESILAADLEETSKKTKEHIKDIGKYIDDTYLKVKKLRNDIFEEGQEDEIQKRTDKAINQYKERSIEFNNILAQNRRMLAKSTKALTDDQRKKLEEMNDDIKAAWDKLSDNFLRQTELIAIDRKIREQSRKEKRTSANLEATRGNIEKEYAYRRQLIKLEMQKELLENSKLLKEDQVSEESILLKYFYKLIELDKKYADEVLAIRKNMNDAILLNVSEFSKEAYKAQLDNINIAFTQEVNKILTEGGIAYKDVMDEYAEINSEAGAEAALAFFNSYIDSLEDPGLKLKLMKALAEYQKNVNDFTVSDEDKKRQLRHELELSKLPEGNSLARDILMAQHELEDLQAKLDAWRKGTIKLSDEQVQIILNNIDKVKAKFGELRLEAFSKYGLLGGMLANIAPSFFGEEQLSALEQAKQTIINSLNEILNAEIQIREKEKELAEQRANDAKSAYEKEIEARNNGYAHNVDTAKKELLLQQQTLRKKQAELEKAQRAQAVIDSMSQASSLTTAAAGFWQAFAPMGLWGILLAAVATAGMFTAFIASKAKAAQLTSTYGKGGLEFLEGGSHASGNDIDLHTKNSRGRNMRAEGGEALAIINKRSTAKYRSILPDLIASLNDGTFLNKYSASINAVQQTVGNNVDLYNIESSLGTLVRQGRNQVYELGDATVIMRGNTRTVIRHQR